MFTERAKTILAGLGLATNARKYLRTGNPDVACKSATVPAGVEIVRSPPAEPVMAIPEVQPEAKPAAAADTVKLVVRIRSISDKWIILHEPVPNGTIWVYRSHVLAINPLPDGDNSEIVVSLKVAKKKGWVTIAGAER